MNDPDPRPQKPEKPLPCDCCDGGCEPCVYDVYADEMEAYAKALAAWQARHPDAAA
ncbi:MAG: oxidoreductase-like protein [Rhodanobacteraceae bacterium]|nr:MAG: oxidoreductase-like protein [Rhodanobacteraceae bacterium]